jgi:hypothetical protein
MHIQPAPKLDRPIVILGLLFFALSSSAFAATASAPTASSREAFAAQVTQLERDVAALRAGTPDVVRSFRAEDSAARLTELAKRLGDLRGISRRLGLDDASSPARWEALRQTLEGSLPPAGSPAAAPMANEATVRGQIRRDAGGAAAKANVILAPVSDPFAFYIDFTDDTGGYEIEVPPGSYYLKVIPVSPDDDLLGELFPGVTCGSGCDWTDGDSLQLFPNQIRTVDFRLTAKGRIEGTVRDRQSGEPLAFAQVALFNSNHNFVSSTFAVDGAYRLAAERGDYYVRFIGEGTPYLGQLYRQVDCLGQHETCDFSLGTRIAVEDGETDINIDFEARRGGRLSGELRAAGTGAPLQGWINLWNEDGVHLTEVSVTNDGHWQIEGLAPGPWYLEARSIGYLAQAWQGHDCNGEACGTRGDLLATPPGSVNDDVDFQLAKGAAIAGQILDDHTSAGVGGVLVQAYGPDVNIPHKAAFTGPDGTFSMVGLAAGTYYLIATSGGYRPEAYDDVPEADFRANPALGTPITVANGATASGIAMRLTPRAGISARVLDAVTGEPVHFPRVYVWSVTDPNDPIQVVDLSNGDDFTIRGLDAGEYYLGADSAPSHKAPRMLGTPSCHFWVNGRNLCPLAQATRIRLADGEIQGVFELRLEDTALVHASIVGGVDRTVTLQLVDADGREVARTSNHPGAPFTIGGLAPGDYWIAILGAPHNVNQLYPASAGECGRWFCDPREGQRIFLRPGEQFNVGLITLQAAHPYAGCQPSATAACLNQGRFRVEARWGDYLGQTGSGLASELTDETVTFTFFSPTNIEIVVKVLNACSVDLGHHFWVFAAGLTNVDVTIRVTDTLTGEVVERRSPLATPFAPILDTGAFATCDAVEPPPPSGIAAPAVEPSMVADLAPASDAAAVSGTCTPDPNHLCLVDGRFKVKAIYRSTPPDPYPFYDVSLVPLSPDVGYGYYFSADNVELLIKMLDACDQYGQFWFFATGLTNVFTTIEVEDTTTGVKKTYPGVEGPFQPIIDIATFGCG